MGTGWMTIFGGTAPFCPALVPCLPKFATNGDESGLKRLAYSLLFLLIMQLLNFSAAPAAELFYSHILRCIGQSLLEYDLKAFDIKCEDDLYLVQGWQKGNPRTAGISAGVKERYTLEDLRRIDLDEMRKRRAGTSRANPLDIAQLLRTAGNYVDFMGARLLRVEWQYQSDKVQSITIQYQAPDAEDTPGAIDEVCVHIYKERKKMRPLPRLVHSEN